VLGASVDAVWRVAGAPDQQARWWPGVVRVEDAGPDGFTQVHRTRKGRTVRADFRVERRDPPRELVCVQLLEGTPFERLLAASQLAIVLRPEGDGTRVELELRQSWHGVGRLGAPLARRASRRRLDEALDALAAAV
jgi:uncharacterized protein YndB with AHSA1/START domain